MYEFPSYPAGLDDLPGMLDQKFDVVIIELDSDPEFALELVESIGSDGMATVMVYSASADPELLVRCMRAGAREFLTLPLAPEVMAEALVRAAARRPLMQAAEEDEREAAGVPGGKGRRRRDHAGLQFRSGAGQGIGREDAADRSRCPARRCCAEPGDRPRVFDHRRPGCGGKAGLAAFSRSFWQSTVRA